MSNPLSNRPSGPTAAMAVAIAALVAAGIGTAGAQVGGDGGGDSAEVKSAAKKKGKRGPRGPRGPRGFTGPTGAKGADGAPGAPGAPGPGATKIFKDLGPPNNTNQLLFANAEFRILATCGADGAGFNVYAERVGTTTVSLDGTFTLADGNASPGAIVASSGVGALLNGTPNTAGTLFEVNIDDSRGTAHGTIVVPAVQKVYQYDISVAKFNTVCFIRGGVTPTT